MFNITDRTHLPKDIRDGTELVTQFSFTDVTKIAAKYYKLDSKVSIALGLASTLFSVSRASSVRAESILAVLAWLFIYFLICYGHASNRGQRVGYSVVAGFILALLVITNVNPIILVPALNITVVLVRVFKKKWIVNILAFIPLFNFK